MDDFNLNKNNILITGGGGFLAKSFIEKIILSNGLPILIDFDINKLKVTQKYFEKKFQFKLPIYLADLSKESQVCKLFMKLNKDYESLDVLINNAAPNPTFDEVKKSNFDFYNFSLKAWKRDIDAGLTSAFLCSKYYSMLENKKQRVVINISSDLGIIAPNQSIYKSKNSISYKPISYSVMKHGIIGLTKYCSTFWIDKRIRCNAVAFGGVENKQPKHFINKVKKLIPMGRLAKKDEYGSTIVYLASNASSYMNGSVVVVDGGRTVW